MTPSLPPWRTGSRGARDGAAWAKGTAVPDPSQPGAPRSGAPDRLAQSAALAEGLPAAFAASTFNPADPALAGVFMAGSRTTRLCTGALPVPMRREIAWWVATCQASGERQIHASEWNRWAATAADVVQRRPEVCSFADLPLSEWMTAWGRVFHARHGRMASAASRARAEIALRALLRRLAVRYSDAPWWRHDIWSLKLDPRIPRRPHESRGNTAACWDTLEPAWLREGFKFYLRLQLESGQLTWSSVMNQHVIAFRFAAFLASRNISHPALADGPGLRALAQDPARPGGQRRSSGGADRCPQPAGDRPVLPGDERLPGRGRRRARRRPLAGAVRRARPPLPGRRLEPRPGDPPGR